MHVCCLRTQRIALMSPAMASAMTARSGGEHTNLEPPASHIFYGVIYIFFHKISLSIYMPAPLYEEFKYFVEV